MQRRTVILHRSGKICVSVYCGNTYCAETDYSLVSLYAKNMRTLLSYLNFCSCGILLQLTQTDRSDTQNLIECAVVK